MANRIKPTVPTRVGRILALAGIGAATGCTVGIGAYWSEVVALCAPDMGFPTTWPELEFMLIFEVAPVAKPILSMTFVGLLSLALFALSTALALPRPHLARADTAALAASLAAVAAAFGNSAIESTGLAIAVFGSVMTGLGPWLWQKRRGGLRMTDHASVTLPMPLHRTVDLISARHRASVVTRIGAHRIEVRTRRPGRFGPAIQYSYGLTLLGTHSTRLELTVEAWDLAPVDLWDLWIRPIATEGSNQIIALTQRPLTKRGKVGNSVRTTAAAAQRPA